MNPLANSPSSTGSSSERLSTGISRENLLSLYVPAFILSLGTGIAAPAIPIFAKSFGVSFGVASLIIIVHSVGELLSTLPTGYLVDRIGRRKIVLAGPLLTAVASFLVATARSFPQLLLYRFLGGWATQMWMLGRLVVIADTSRQQQRGRQITGMVSVQRTGMLMGPVLGGLAAAAWGIRVPFLIHGALAVLSVIPSFTLLRESAPARPAPKAPGAASARGPGSLAALLVFPVLALLVAQFFTNMARGALQGGGGSLFLYATYAYGSGPATLGILGTAGAILGIPITLTAGYIMDRFGRKATIVPGSALLGAGMLFIAVGIPLHAPFLVYATGFVWVTLAMSLMAGSMQTLGTDIAPPDARGRFFGVVRLVSHIGGVLSPVVFALLSEGVSFTAAFLFLASTGFTASLVVALLIKETLQKPATGAPAKPQGSSH